MPLQPLVIHVAPSWSAERCEQVIQAAHERAGRPWPVQWRPGHAPTMVLIHMHLDDEGKVNE